MKLRDYMNGIDDDMTVRIFAGCMTIFHGKKVDVSEKEWNIKVRPYMDYDVVRESIINGVNVLSIW